jgi:probable rRNA maturation factor
VAVDVRCQAARGRQLVPLLRKDARALLARLVLDRAELSILLTDDRQIQDLNRVYRCKDKPTDVLSFPQLDESPIYDAGLGGAADRSIGFSRCFFRENHGLKPIPLGCPPLPLGDIVISLETASRQAWALAQSRAERVRTLLIHGLLHLLGYDHERSPAEARRMSARERELAAGLDACGILKTAPRRALTRSTRATACDGAGRRGGEQERATRKHHTRLRS